MKPVRVALLGTRANETNPRLVETWHELGVDCQLVSPAIARWRHGDFDVALARLDVLPSLDGVEPGLLDLLWLERGALRVLNPVRVLLATHDKLRTVGALARAGIPQPRTSHLSRSSSSSLPHAPLVLKPRFGSWGKDVRLCRTNGEVRRTLAELSARPWFRRHGVLVQEVVPSAGRDLRVLVAGHRVVGAIERVAAPGEWRTNISVGGSRSPTVPSPEACALAIAAAAAVEGDLVGVDLLPLPGGGYTVIELNGAVDFDDEYSQPGRHVDEEAALALGFLPLAQNLGVAEDSSRARAAAP